MGTFIFYVMAISIAFAIMAGVADFIDLFFWR